ncbi:hypothetical protein P9112_005284 [Eukaryota sp. TZLM1-RC]
MTNDIPPQQNLLDDHSIAEETVEHTENPTNDILISEEHVVVSCDDDDIWAGSSKSDNEPLVPTPPSSPEPSTTEVLPTTDTVTPVSPLLEDDPQLFKQDIKALIRLGIPAAMTFLFTISLALTDSIMVGRFLGTSALATVSVSSSFIQTTLFIPFMSSMALDAFANQAIGANKYKLVGVYLQQAIVVALALALIPIILWTFSPLIFTILGFNADLVSNIAVYVRTQLLGLPFFLGFKILGSKVLECQGIVVPQMIIYALTNFFNIATNYLFINTLNMGLFGASLSTALARVWPCIFLVWYHRRYGTLKKVWSPWRRENVEWVRVKAYLAVGLPAVYFFLLEGGALMIWSIISGLLGEVEASAYNIIYMSTGVSYVFSIGLGVATAVKTGHLVGKGCPVRARKTALTGVLMSAGVMTCWGLFFLIMRGHIARLFVSDPEVIELAETLFLLALLYQIGAGINAVTNGILRALGKTKTSAINAGVHFYLIAMPLSLLLTFVFDFEVIGVWIAIVVALNGSGLTLLTIIRKIDFGREVEIALARLMAKRRASSVV